ncbi:MAG: response regulator transcription factor [Gammaproteobacteria bacterium]|nr:response regulator transcription factor [Gammaproteobacteria bacterium]
MVDDRCRLCRLIESIFAQGRLQSRRVGAWSRANAARTWMPRRWFFWTCACPGFSGLDLATRESVRNRPRWASLWSTGSDDEIDKIVGLEVGADDYVCKPFNERELLARIRSVLRRIDLDSGSGVSGLRFEDFTLDLEAHRLTCSGTEIGLTGHEYNLLVMLAERSNRVFTRDEISRRVSNREWYPDDRSVDVLVSKLRKKLEAHGGHNIIKSLRGVGYQFSARVEKLQSASLYKHVVHFGITSRR